MPQTPARGVPARIDVRLLHATSHVRTATRQESNLRQRYLSLDGQSQPKDSVAELDLLARSVAVLELLLVGACLAETEQRLREQQLDLSKSPQLVLDQLAAVCHLDVEAVVDNAYHQLRDEIEDVAARDVRPDLTMSGLIHAVRGVLAACPIDALSMMADRVGAQELGHRCRTAVDALQAFLVRVDPKQHEKVAAVGRLYASGQVDVHLVAAITELDVPDAVVLLERNGFHRPIETIRLSDADRRAILKRMHADRQARGSGPVSHLARRDALASSRIEGVDARHLQ